MLFSGFKMLLLMSRMGEAELSAKVRKTTSLLLTAHTTSLPAITSLKGQHGRCSVPAKCPSLLVVQTLLPMNNGNKTHCGTAATGGKTEPTSYRKDDLKSTCSSLHHGTNGLKMTYAPTESTHA